MTSTTPNLGAFPDRLAEFIRDRVASRWVKGPYFEVYVRHSFRFHDGQRVNSLDLANINVQEKYRRRGIFKAVLSRMIDINPWDAVLVENACPHLASYLRQLSGWERYQYSQDETYILIK